MTFIRNIEKGIYNEFWILLDEKRKKERNSENFKNNVLKNERELYNSDGNF